MDIALECGHRLVNQFTSVGLFVIDLETEGTNLVQFRELYKMPSETVYRVLQCLDRTIEGALTGYEILDETFSAIWAYLLLKRHSDMRAHIAEMEQQLFSTYPLCKEPYLLARKLADLYSYQIYEIFQTAAMTNITHLLTSFMRMEKEGWKPNHVSLPRDEEWPDGRLTLFLRQCVEEADDHPLGAKRLLPKSFLMNHLFKNLQHKFSNRFSMVDLVAMTNEDARTMLPDIFQNVSSELFSAWQSKMSFLRSHQRRNLEQNRKLIPGVTAIPAITLALLDGKFDLRIGWKHEKFSPHEQEFVKQHFDYTLVKRAILDGRDECPLKSFRNGCTERCEHEAVITSLHASSLPRGSR